MSEEYLIDIDEKDTKAIWKSFAIMEIKLSTHFVRRHRRSFFGIIYVMLIFWAIIGAPSLFHWIFQSFPIEDVELFKVIIGIIIETILMTLFIILLMFPLNTVYRKVDNGFQELILATPISAEDIFIGRFLGKWSFYGIAFFIISPIIVGLLGSIVNLTIFQYIVIYASIFGMIFLANLIGTIMATWIEHRILKNEKARDWGKALIMVLSILMVFVMYSVMFFLREIVENKELRNWLMFYPALWYSNIIQYIIDPVLIESYILNIWMNILLATGIPLLTLYLAYRGASEFYSLEESIEKTSVSIHKDNVVYKGIQRVAGHKWGGLIVVQLKLFMRKKENFARLGFVVGFLAFFGWFYARQMSYMDAEGIIVMTMLLVIMGSMFYSLMIGSLIFVDSKELIGVYKKSPRGVEGLISSYLLAMLILDLLVGILNSIFISIFCAFRLWQAVIFFLTYISYSMIAMIEIIGVNCFSPAYELRGGRIFVNSQIAMVVQMGCLYFMMFFMFRYIPNGASPLLIYSIVFMPLFAINITVALVILRFGLKKLNRME
ncbi:MAG: conserved membrane protein of unknown function [Promethearchaeota archaeon]|nr:MAG: conserved membrane protein of unknown function [Candidatus Lokiarchaeota archaeon]